MKYILYIAIFAMAATMVAQDSNNNWKGNRPDGHAPISIGGDHTHGKGGFMVSYKYMYMNMQDLKRGSEDVSFSNALADYMVTPTQMPMNMHMLGIMYAPSDRLTLGVMSSYIENDMDHIARNGITFTTKTAGIGDTKISGLYKIFNKNKKQLHGKLGISLPTGSIDEGDILPVSMGNKVILPYPMQIGSGTWDVVAGATFLWQAGTRFSGGNQLNATLRTGENDNGYTLGNRYGLNNWFAYRAANVMSLSLRFKGQMIEGIKGENEALNPMMVITADTNNAGGTIVDTGVGVNFYAPKGALKNLRLGLELSYPLYQDLDGIQLKTKEVFTAGLQYAF